MSASAIRRTFADAADLVAREVTVAGQRVQLFFLDGLTSASEIADFVLKPLAALPPCGADTLIRSCADGTVYAAVAVRCESADDACAKLTAGFCVLCVGEALLAFEVKSGEKRAPSPPQVENTVKGAKDAFTETLRTNTALIRRHVRTPQLQIREFTVGRRSRTTVALLSIGGLTDPALVSDMARRIESIDVDGMLTPAAVEEYLTGSRRTAFPLLQYTERADRFSQGLLDGQLGVLADGLPLGYLAPVCVGRLMTSPEDRGRDYVSASAVRLIRYLALALHLLLPGLFVAMAQFHPAMIPTPLLRAILQSKEQVPFPTVMEVLGLLIAFELLQQAGLHLPQSIGSTVSIIGGLVVGTAAVEARLISPSALIVVAAAGVCGFALPQQDLSNAARVWQFALTVCASVAGLFGLTAGGLCLLVRLGSLTSFGRPYLAPFSEGIPAGLVRPRLATQKYRDPLLRAQDRRNQR
ncbi:MAG: spore germination protein [Oscillospiraceae bacterium]|nr:spore germination protein [Oscillospiraceae bacterium]